MTTYTVAETVKAGTLLATDPATGELVAHIDGAPGPMAGEDLTAGAIVRVSATGFTAHRIPTYAYGAIRAKAILDELYALADGTIDDDLAALVHGSGLDAALEALIARRLGDTP